MSRRVRKLLDPDQLSRAMVSLFGAARPTGLAHPSPLMMSKDSTLNRRIHVSTAIRNGNCPVYPVRFANIACEASRRAFSSGAEGDSLAVDKLSMSDIRQLLDEA